MPHMRWSLKFTAKGKKDGSGTGPGKSYQGAADSFRNGVGTAGHQSFRSGSDVDRSDRDNDRHRESGANDSNSRTPIVTPPDANGGGRAESGQSKLAEPGQETEGHNSSPPYSAGREGAVGEGGNGGETEGDGQQRLEDMDESPRRVGGDNQDDVFDDESQEDADSLHASKTARMKSFADDPEAHALGDLGADWDGEALRSSSGKLDFTFHSLLHPLLFTSGLKCTSGLGEYLSSLASYLYRFRPPTPVSRAPPLSLCPRNFAQQHQYMEYPSRILYLNTCSGSITTTNYKLHTKTVLYFVTRSDPRLGRNRAIKTPAYYCYQYATRCTSV